MRRVGRIVTSSRRPSLAVSLDSLAQLPIGPPSVAPVGAPLLATQERMTFGYCPEFIYCVLIT